MENLTKDLFTVVGKNVEKMDSISRPNLSFWKDAWRRLKKNRAAFVGLCILVIFALLAIFAPMFSQYTYTSMDTSAVNATPSASHWLGADSAGRDLWVRVWMGARVSLSIGLIAAVINACVGAVPCAATMAASWR